MQSVGICVWELSHSNTPSPVAGSPSKPLNKSISNPTNLALRQPSSSTLLGNNSPSIRRQHAASSINFPDPSEYQLSPARSANNLSDITFEGVKNVDQQDVNYNEEEISTSSSNIIAEDEETDDTSTQSSTNNVSQGTPLRKAAPAPIQSKVVISSSISNLSETQSSTSTLTAQKSSANMPDALNLLISKYIKLMHFKYWSKFFSEISTILPLDFKNYKSKNPLIQSNVFISMIEKIENLEFISLTPQSSVNFSKHWNQWYQNPYLHLIIVPNMDNQPDEYKNVCKPKLKEITSVLNEKEHEYLIVYMADSSDSPVSSAPSMNLLKKLTTSNLGDKVKSDFNDNKNRVLVLKQRSQEHLLEFSSRLKEVILIEFTKRCQRYETEIKKSQQNSKLPGWQLHSYFLLKEGLAITLEQVGLYASALAIYKELKSQIKQLPLPFVFQDTCTQLHKILDIHSKPYRQEILEQSISRFDFSNYIFARECTLFLALNTPIEVATHALPYVRKRIALLQKEPAVEPLFVHFWAFCSIICIVEACQKKAFDITPDALKQLCKVLGDLYQFALFQLSILAKQFHLRFFSLEESTPLHSSDTVTISSQVNTSVTFASHYDVAIRVQKIMHQQNELDKLVMELLTANLRVYRNGGERDRFSQLISYQMALLRAQQHKFQEAIPILEPLLQYKDGNRPLLEDVELETKSRQLLAHCYKQLHWMSHYALQCLLLQYSCTAQQSFYEKEFLFAMQQSPTSVEGNNHILTKEWNGWEFLFTKEWNGVECFAGESFTMDCSLYSTNNSVAITVPIMAVHLDLELLPKESPFLVSSVHSHESISQSSSAAKHSIRLSHTCPTQQWNVSHPLSFQGVKWKCHQMGAYLLKRVVLQLTEYLCVSIPFGFYQLPQQVVSLHSEHLSQGYFYQQSSTTPLTLSMIPNSILHHSQHSSIQQQSLQLASMNAVNALALTTTSIMHKVVLYCKPSQCNVTVSWQMKPVYVVNRNAIQVIVMQIHTNQDVILHGFVKLKHLTEGMHIVTTQPIHVKVMSESGQVTREKSVQWNEETKSISFLPHLQEQEWLEIHLPIQITLFKSQFQIKMDLSGEKENGTIFDLTDQTCDIPVVEPLLPVYHVKSIDSFQYVLQLQIECLSPVSLLLSMSPMQWSKGLTCVNDKNSKVYPQLLTPEGMRMESQDSITLVYVIKVTNRNLTSGQATLKLQYELLDQQFWMEIPLEWKVKVTDPFLLHLSCKQSKPIVYETVTCNCQIVMQEQVLKEEFLWMEIQVDANHWIVQGNQWKYISFTNHTNEIDLELIPLQSGYLKFPSIVLHYQKEVSTSVIATVHYDKEMMIGNRILIYPNNEKEGTMGPMHLISEEYEIRNIASVNPFVHGYFYYQPAQLEVVSDKKSNKSKQEEVNQEEEEDNTSDAASNQQGDRESVDSFEQVKVGHELKLMVSTIPNGSGGSSIGMNPLQSTRSVLNTNLLSVRGAKAQHSKLMVRTSSANPNGPNDDDENLHSIALSTVYEKSTRLRK